MKDWPVYFKDCLTVSNKKSNVGVCTLWTPKYAILDKLDKISFCIGGQLYSKRGINFIIRNILANPSIDHIVLCGADKSESGEAFLRFMKRGIGGDYKVRGDPKCEIHKQISRKAIEKFRKNVKIIDARGEIDSDRLKREISRIKVSSKMWAKPEQFKEAKIAAPDKFPSEKTTFSLRANYIWEAWVQILRLIMRFGSKRGIIKIGEVKELVNIVTVIEKEDPYNPEIADIFGFEKKDLMAYYKNFFSPNKGTEDYNYGERIFKYPLGMPNGTFNAPINAKLLKKISSGNKKFEAAPEVRHYRACCGLDQLEEIYEKYQRYHDDRGLVAIILNPWIDNVKHGWMADKNKNLAGNIPCMALLQFTYRSKKLHLTAYFRSNDMFDAWPRNAFALRKLQFDLAKRIKKKPGYLTTISNCAQVYETNYKEAARIVAKYDSSTFCTSDPRGALIIETQQNEIVVKHMSPDGNTQLGEFRINGLLPKASLKLIDKLQVSCLFSKNSHIADIAIELTKAEWCVKNKRRFVQDRDWGDLKKRV